jgi:ribonuclease HI
MDDADGIVLNRKLTLCPSTEDWPVADLIKQCPNCEDFLLYCCGCNNRNRNLPKRKQPTEPCHHYRIIFTDGACMNNGQAAAKAGVGAAYGTREETQLSEPITNVFENLMPRSNQRAELWAARLGLQFMAEALVDSKSEAWILATDSEYVVKGMTEWLPTWKV